MQTNGIRVEKKNLHSSVFQVRVPAKVSFPLKAKDVIVEFSKEKLKVGLKVGTVKLHFSIHSHGMFPSLFQVSFIMSHAYAIFHVI